MRNGSEFVFWPAHICIPIHTQLHTCVPTHTHTYCTYINMHIHEHRHITCRHAHTKGEILYSLWIFLVVTSEVSFSSFALCLEVSPGILFPTLFGPLGIRHGRQRPNLSCSYVLRRLSAVTWLRSMGAAFPFEEGWSMEGW